MVERELNATLLPSRDIQGVIAVAVLLPKNPVLVVSNTCCWPVLRSRTTLRRLNPLGFWTLNAMRLPSAESDGSPPST